MFNISKPYTPSQPVTGITLLFFFILFMVCNVPFIVCLALWCCVLFERGVLFWRYVYLCVVSYCSNTATRRTPFAVIIIIAFIALALVLCRSACAALNLCAAGVAQWPQAKMLTFCVQRHFINNGNFLCAVDLVPPAFIRVALSLVRQNMPTLRIVRPRLTNV
jgi:hypothetical protein